MAKITVTTDKAGRKVYKVAGTKKYAYSMAKAKEIASKESGTAKRAPVGVRVSKKKPSAAAAKKYAAFEEKLVNTLIRSLMGLADYKKAHAAFKKDAYKAAAKYGVNEDYISPKFVRTVLRELKYEIDDLEGFRRRDAEGFRRGEQRLARVKKELATPAGRAKYRKLQKAAESTRGLMSVTRKKTTSRKKPTKVLGRSIESALKIVRTKGRGLKETDANKKLTVAKYRKALQKAGYLR